MRPSAKEALRTEATDVMQRAEKVDELVRLQQVSQRASAATATATATSPTTAAALLPAAIPSITTAHTNSLANSSTTSGRRLIARRGWRPRGSRPMDAGRGELPSDEMKNHQKQRSRRLAAGSRQHANGNPNEYEHDMTK